jgi:hypothetical protein
MTNLEKILSISVGGVLVLLLVVGHCESKSVTKQQAIAAQALQEAKEDAAKVVEADKARDTAKAQADGFKAQSEAALTQSKSKDKDIAALKAKLAAMKPQPPVTNDATLPTDPQGLAADYTAQGFPPSEVGPTMGWPVASVVPMLGLLIDGKQYPSALERIDDLTQENTLHEQKEADLTTALGDQTKRGDSLDMALADSKQAEVACADEVTDLKTAVTADQKIIKSEKVQKFTWGAVGAVAGWVIRTVVFHWPF